MGEKIRRDALAILFLTVGIFLTVALVSFHQVDPSLSAWSSGAGGIRNWGGWVGAILSDLLLQLFGIGAIGFPALCLALAYWTFRGEGISGKWGRAAGGLIAVCCLLGVLSFFTGHIRILDQGIFLPGIVGYLLGVNFFGRLLNPVGGLLCLSALLLFSLMLFTGLPLSGMPSLWRRKTSPEKVRAIVKEKLSPKEEWEPSSPHPEPPREAPPPRIVAPSPAPAPGPPGGGPPPAHRRPPPPPRRARAGRRGGRQGVRAPAAGAAGACRCGRKRRGRGIPPQERGNLDRKTLPVRDRRHDHRDPDRAPRHHVRIPAGAGDQSDPRRGDGGRSGAGDAMRIGPRCPQHPRKGSHGFRDPQRGTGPHQPPGNPRKPALRGVGGDSVACPREGHLQRTGRPGPLEDAAPPDRRRHRVGEERRPPYHDPVDPVPRDARGGEVHPGRPQDARAHALRRDPPSLP